MPGPLECAQRPGIRVAFKGLTADDPLSSAHRMPVHGDEGGFRGFDGRIQGILEVHNDVSRRRWRGQGKNNSLFRSGAEKDLLRLSRPIR